MFSQKDHTSSLMLKFVCVKILDISMKKKKPGAAHKTTKPVTVKLCLQLRWPSHNPKLWQNARHNEMHLARTLHTLSLFRNIHSPTGIIFRHVISDFKRRKIVYNTNISVCCFGEGRNTEALAFKWVTVKLVKQAVCGNFFFRIVFNIPMHLQETLE